MDLHVLKGTHISAILAFLGFFPMMDIRVMDGRTPEHPTMVEVCVQAIRAPALNVHTLLSPVRQCSGSIPLSIGCRL